MTRRYWMGGNRSYDQDRFFDETLAKWGWQKGEEGHWEACWYTGMPSKSFFREVGPERKINHIPGNNALTVKSRLHQSLVSLRERVGIQSPATPALTQRLGFVPGIYSMPEDYHAFQQAALAQPDKRWLLKPKNAARGKGIELVKDPATVPMDSAWMVQEYLEKPHTMRGRKYVLRLYVLVSSISPFRVYLYRQGFAKLASAPYDEENADNPYSYLTNPDVNALNLDADVPVEFVELAKYRQWIREQGHDPDTLFARIEDLVALTCFSALETMRARCAEAGTDPRGCYELMGIDCLIDQQLQPWVLECNLSPSLEVCAGPESGGDIEEGVKRSLIEDMLRLVGLTRSSRDSSEPDTPEQALIAQTEQELANAGGFQRLYPCAEPESYMPYFSMPRLEDWVVARAVSHTPLPEPKVRPRYAEEMLSDDRVYLYETHRGRLSALNETASLIWLMAQEGAGPEQIAQALIEASQASSAEETWRIRKDVWDSLADWVNKGLLIQAGQGEASAQADQPHQSRLAEPNPIEFSKSLQCGAFSVELFTDSEPLSQRLADLLPPLKAGSKTQIQSRLELVRDTPGYTLVLDGKVIASRLQLAQVAPALMACLARRAAEAGDIILDAGLVASPQSKTGLLVASGNKAVSDAFSLHLAQTRQESFSRALRFRAGQGERLDALGLAAQIPQTLLGSLGKVVKVNRHRLQDNRELALIPSAQSLSGLSLGIQTVIVPTDAEITEPSGVAELTVSETLRHLIPACNGPKGQPLDGPGFQRLAQWLESKNRLLIDVRNLESATTAAQRAVQSEAVVS